MRWLTASLLLASLLLPPTLSGQNHRAGPCPVSENYLEALGENQRTLLGLVYMANSTDSAFEGRSGGIAYYTMLASTRRYHIEVHSRLDPCARALNLATIDTLSSAADLVVMVLARSTEPESRWAENRAQAAVERLNASWDRLVELTETTVLEVP